MQPNYLFSPPPRVSLPVQGAVPRFPVRRVYCIGRNYADHVAELGNRLEGQPPYFLKPAEALDSSGQFPYPSQSEDVHHEVEVLVALKAGGSNISAEEALSAVCGYGLALDMTCRDLQSKAKKAGHPWEIAKSFEASAPAGPLHLVEDVGHLTSGRLALSVNDELRQEGDLSQMIWPVPELISFLSRYYTLAAGDVILTGTPAGVGPVAVGDHLRAICDGLSPLEVTVV